MVVPTGTLVLEAVHSSGLLTPTHYVSNSGTASWSAATNASTPCSAATAMANAVAGNVVQFATGRYTVTGSGSRSVPALNPAYSGTDGNPITFQHDGGVVDFTFSSGSSATIGAYGRSYITWYGFKVDQALCPGSGGEPSTCVLWNSSHCIIDHCEFDGNGATGDPNGDLHAGVRIDGVEGHDNTVKNCLIYAFTQGLTSSTGNSSGVLIDNQIGGTTTIEHNEIYNCNVGVTHKMGWEYGTSSYVVRRNYIYDCFGPFTVNQYHSTPGYTYDIYQNLCIGRSSPNPGVALQSNQTTSDRESRYIRIINNTFVGYHYDAGGGLCLSIGPGITDAGHVSWNNILVDCEIAPYSTRSGCDLADFTQANCDCEHNVYHGSTYQFAHDLEGAAVYYTWAQWQGINQDLATGNGKAGQVADPLFTNEAGGDYTLQSESPAKDAGVDILNLLGGGTSAACDAGCYVVAGETIGRE